MPDEVINKHLEVFYTEMKRKDGRSVSWSYFVCIRAGIFRYLRGPPHYREISYTLDPAYASSTRVFMSVVKKLKEAEVTTYNRNSITKEDLLKINSAGAFDLNNPKELQEKVFFDIQYFLSHHTTKEEIRELTKHVFRLKTDESGKEYIEMQYSNKDRGCMSPRMYATGDETCPVYSLKKYLGKLDPLCPILYVHPKNQKAKSDPSSIASTIWYTTKPMGKNTIGMFMGNISKRLKLSYPYTNSYIRLTRKKLIAK